MGFFAKCRTTFADVESELYPLWDDMILSVGQLFAGIRGQSAQEAKAWKDGILQGSARDRRNRANLYCGVAR